MPEKKMIDWEAYRKGLRELEKSGTPPDTLNHQPRLPPPDNQADPGTELLRQQARNAGQTARSLAAGNVGLHLGDLLGAGDAPVADFNEKPVLEAFGKHDQLMRLLGDRLTQNYRQRLTLQDKADRQAAETTARRLLQNERAAQQLSLQQHRQLLDAATYKVPEPQQEAKKRNGTQPRGTTAAKSTGTARHRAGEQPFRIADTDGQHLMGYWNLTPDEAAQILQTAIDLGDQAQLDYVSRLTGGSATNRQTTTAQVMALRQKAMSGNASARQRMVQLLTAIIPSLRGKKVIDGILDARYERRQHR